MYATFYLIKQCWHTRCRAGRRQERLSAYPGLVLHEQEAVDQERHVASLAIGLNGRHKRTPGPGQAEIFSSHLKLDFVACWVAAAK